MQGGEGPAASATSIYADQAAGDMPAALLGRTDPTTPLILDFDET